MTGNSAILLEDAVKRADTAEELLKDCFEQACESPTSGDIDHMHISAYESAQRYLIHRGLIGQEQCVYVERPWED
jgi:hypothetical protein